MPENEAPKVLHLLRITAPPDRANDLQFNLIYRLPVKPVTLSEADVNDNVVYIDIPSGSPIVQHIVDNVNQLDNFDLTGFVFETVDYNRETGEFSDTQKVLGIDYSTHKEPVSNTDSTVDEQNDTQDTDNNSVSESESEPEPEPEHESENYEPDILDSDTSDEDDYSIDDDVEVIADKVRENDERVERAEDDDETLAEELSTNDKLSLSYVSSIDLDKQEIQPYLLPEFAATRACEVVADSVKNPILATSKRDLLRNVREVSLLSEDADDNEFIVDGAYENEDSVNAHLKFLKETSKLSREFANDRSKVQDMSPEEVDKLLSDIQDTLYPEMSRDFDNVDSVRVSVKDSIDDVNNAIVQYRLQYLDDMKQVMETAAFDAAVKYADENRKDVLQACSDEMLLNTRENAETFGKSTSQVISMLLKADYLIDIRDDISDELRAKYHALLAVAQYRAYSDKAMAEMVCELTEKRAAEIEETYSENEPDGETEDNVSNVDDSDVEDIDVSDDGNQEQADDLESVDETDVPNDTDAITDDVISDAESLDNFGDLDEPDSDLGNDADITNNLSTASDDLDFGEVEDDIVDEPEKPLSKKELKKLEREKKKAERAEKRKNRKPLPLPAKIAIGVVTALIVIAGAVFYFFNMATGKGQSVESKTDPRGTYQVGESYTVNIKGSDGKATEKNLTVSKFVDSPDDSKDAIIAVDKDGKEYRISYDKMKDMKKADTQNSDSGSQTTDSGSSSTE